MLALSIDIVLGMVEVSVGVPKKRYVPPFDSQYDHKHEVSNHLLLGDHCNDLDDQGDEW